MNTPFANYLIGYLLTQQIQLCDGPLDTLRGIEKLLLIPESSPFHKFAQDILRNLNKPKGTQQAKLMIEPLPPAYAPEDTDTSTEVQTVNQTEYPEITYPVLDMPSVQMQQTFAQTTVEETSTKEEIETDKVAYLAEYMPSAPNMEDENPVVELTSATSIQYPMLTNSVYNTFRYKTFTEAELINKYNKTIDTCITQSISTANSLPVQPQNTASTSPKSEQKSNVDDSVSAKALITKKTPKLKQPTPIQDEAPPQTKKTTVRKTLIPG